MTHPPHMNSKTVCYIALLCAIAALVLQLESRARLDERVRRIADERERNYCTQLAIKLNESRELMGLKPVSPKNFAEVLTSYFESMATVMNGGISAPSVPEDEKKK